MPTDKQNLPLARPILAGVLAGIIAAFANLIYNYIYRRATDYTATEMVNAYSIIFGSILLLMIAGIIYYLLVRYLKGGIPLFIFVCVILMVVGYFIRLGVAINDDISIHSAGGGLILGIDIISGVGAAILIPYLATHPKLWE